MSRHGAADDLDREVSEYDAMMARFWNREAEQEAWEPWTPQVGQRVMLVRRAECSSCGRDDPRTIRITESLEATVDWIGESHGPGHRYHIVFDAPVMAWTPSGVPALTTGGCFAAAELAPLAPAESREDGCQGR